MSINMPQRNSSHAVDLMIEASEALAASREGRCATIVCVARHRLQDAVDEARDAGIDWKQLGTALGIRPDGAYQRFRRQGKRPQR